MSRTALSLLGCVPPRIQVHLGLPPHYPSDQGRLTRGTVISRDHDPGVRREPLIAHEPVMGSLREHERERARERDRERERERDSPPPGHPFMPPHFSHHAPFSPNPLTQPLPPPLALAPHHSQPPQRRRPPPWIALSWPRGTGSACQTREIPEGSVSVSETAGHARSV